MKFYVECPRHHTTHCVRLPDMRAGINARYSIWDTDSDPPHKFSFWASQIKVSNDALTYLMLPPLLILFVGSLFDPLIGATVGIPAACYIAAWETKRVRAWQRYFADLRRI